MWKYILKVITLALLITTINAVVSLRTGMTWEWQLTDFPIPTLNTTDDIFDVDLFLVTEDEIQTLKSLGKIVICYINAGGYEDWRADAYLYPNNILGKKLDNWSGERWVDIRNITILGTILTARMDLAVAKGCQGIEPDNIDAYEQDTGFHITSETQLAFNLWLVQEAHLRDLSIALKNDLDQIPDLVDYFDFLIVEQCFQFNECYKVTPFIQQNKAVLGVEYYGKTANFCPEANAMNISLMKKNLCLDPWRIDCWSWNGTDVVLDGGWAPNGTLRGLPSVFVLLLLLVLINVI